MSSEVDSFSFEEGNTTHLSVIRQDYDLSWYRCVTTWIPVINWWPSPTSTWRRSRTIPFTFSCWCLHLNPDTSRGQNRYFLSAVAHENLSVGNLFSCEPLSWHRSIKPLKLFLPIVPLLGLSCIDAKPPNYVCYQFSTLKWRGPFFVLNWTYS